MENFCRRCFTPFKPGQKVSVVVTASYQPLKSKIHYALDRSDMVADEATLIHAVGAECDYEEHEA